MLQTSLNKNHIMNFLLTIWHSSAILSQFAIYWIQINVFP